MKENFAALRGGIKTVIIPSENEKAFKDIPQNGKDGMKIIPVKNVGEVPKIALKEEELNQLSDRYKSKELDEESKITTSPH